MASVTEIPSFDFSGLYFAELLQDLITFSRRNTPELMDEDPHEPFVQLLRMMALTEHYQSVLLDHVALESVFATCRLRESLRSHLALIGERLRQATPATADILIKLPTPQTADTVLKKGAIFATQPTNETLSIPFELIDDVTVKTSNVVTYCYEKDAGVYTDRTTKANTDADTFQPWGGVPQAGDALYFGHDTTLWAKAFFKMTVLGDIWDAAKMSLEVYDGQVDTTNPSSVTNPAGNTLRLFCNSLVGTSERSGLIVTITCTLTGAQVTKTLAWSNPNNYVEVDFATEMLLGGVDLTTTTYLIGSKWREVPTATRTEDTTAITEAFEYAVPETETRKWTKVDLNSDLGGASPALTAYWMRIRIIVATATSPTFDRVKIDQGSQYLLVPTSQGRSVTEAELGVSLGVADQVFFTTSDKVIEESVDVFIDEGSGFAPWAEVDNFLASTGLSLDYVVGYDPDGVAQIQFGDGVNGRIPPASAVVKVVYHIEAEDDGNVGAGAITLNQSGFSLVASCTNPRSASGWKMPDGATADDIERIKIEAPANMRARDRLMSIADIAPVATEWTSAAGVSPFARSFVDDEAFGAKTCAVVVVESGSAPVPAATLTEFQTYLNGNPVTDIDAVIILNYQATVVRYTPKLITITATVKGGTKATIEAALKVLLQPLHVESDGTYTFDFGGTVFADRITSEIFKADGAVKNVPTLVVNGVDDTVANADVALGAYELPLVATVTVTVI